MFSSVYIHEAFPSHICVGLHTCGGQKAPGIELKSSAGASPPLSQMPAMLKQFDLRLFFYTEGGSSKVNPCICVCICHLIFLSIDAYKKILETTMTPTGIDTAKLYPILMSSGLPRETLGQIWALANRTTPGRLTKEELYTVLAMVAVTQVDYVAFF